MRNLTFLFSAFCVLFLSSCNSYSPTAQDLSKFNLIPLPLNIIPTGSSFRVTNQTTIHLPNEGEALKALSAQLTEAIAGISDYQIKTRIGVASGKGNISLLLDKNLASEGYKLHISEDDIQISAQGTSGFFYAINTLERLLPVFDIASTENLEIPTGTIEDAPTFGYRGAMLDVARHFFDVNDVKQFIDLIAMYKMNILHLHLSDDQGWRIEIKSWPNLTEHGSKTAVGGGEGGFFSQEDYKEIIRYAASKYITVIPEIDMPGHTNSALASYPELNCNGIATELYSGIEVGFSTLCTDKEITYQFVDDVIRELAELTPGPYIHIGGDESHVTKKEDYIYFVNRTQDIVGKYNKTMIGWDEVANANLKAGNVAQHWAHAKQAQSAVSAGAKLIMSPAKKAYLDMKYHDDTELGLKWANTIEVDTSYMWNPEDYVAGVSKSDILGIEAPLWSETITNMDEIEFLAMPRLAAYAELGWTIKERRHWADFSDRLGREADRYEALGINYYPSTRIEWKSSKPSLKVIKD